MVVVDHETVNYIQYNHNHNHNDNSLHAIAKCLLIDAR